MTSLGAPTEEDWRGVVQLIRDAGQVTLVCHVSPDADALGSALATGLALRALGKDALVSYGEEPFQVPNTLGFLPGLDLLVPPAAVPDTPELLVAFDCASLERLGTLVPKARAAKAFVVLDHHASNTRFGTHHLVDASAPATAVLVDELLRRLGTRLTREVATALYAGLATDTGSFKYAGTTPATHEFAGRLLATGIRHDEISRQLWDTVRFPYLKVLGHALDRARLDTAALGGLGLVWTVVPLADRRAHGLRLDEVESMIDVVRKAAEAEVAVVLKEDDMGAYQVSVRAKGRVDVGAVCTALGGGGHRYAAGFTAHGTVEQVMGDLYQAFEQVSAEPRP